MARLDDVLAILVAPMAPKGEADRGMSPPISFQGSLGEKDDVVPACGAETTRGVGLKEVAEGLKVEAFALSILGEATGDPADE